MKPPTSRLRNYKVAVAGVGLVLLGLVGLWQSVHIADWMRYLQYSPPASIVSINDRVRFSNTGRFYFYASTPTLDGTKNFTERCGHHESSTNIIGCYVNGKIYLYDVSNDELNGIEEVTAAHEMLHAAYDRLSQSRQLQLNKLLQKEIDDHSVDKTFIDRMKVYDDLSYADKLHEYHSVFGTEVRSLSPDLEAHYQQYFDDRQHVVDLYKNYSTIFNNLKNEAEALVESLDKQADIINHKVAKYNQQSLALSADVERFNNKAAAGGFQSQADFQYQRQILTARSDNLTREYQLISQLIKQYNSDKQAYDGLAEHLTELNNSIDSSLAPAPAVN